MESQHFILAGAVVGLGALALLALRRRSRAEGRAGLFPREEQEMVRHQLDRLLAEIQELSREQIARLDNKIRMLQQLLADADARIRELQSLSPREAAPARPANPLHEKVYALADAGRGSLEIGQELGLEKGEVELILGLRKVRPNP